MPSGTSSFLMVSVFFVCNAQCRGTTAGLRSDTDKWLGSYEDATNMANETLSSIQERNIKHPNGGPEASRISAAARRKLANLMTLLDKLADMLESPECMSV
ncbi:TPA: hypothetical protein ACH3X3_001219 [Trebouxia sp. C0006]